MCLTIMDKLLDYCETTQTYERGMEYALRILQFDRVHERTYQKLMRLRFPAEDRTSALREYKHCSQVLIDELGVQPRRSTSKSSTAHWQMRDSSKLSRWLSDPALTSTGSTTTSWSPIDDGKAAGKAATREQRYRGALSRLRR